jgi:hypothetical protein
MESTDRHLTWTRERHFSSEYGCSWTECETGSIKVHPNIELNAVGSELSIDTFRPSKMSEKTSAPCNISTGDDKWNVGSGNAKLENRSCILAGNDCRGILQVIMGNTYALILSTGLDANSWWITHVAIPLTLRTGVADKPLMGVVRNMTP